MLFERQRAEEKFLQTSPSTWWAWMTRGSYSRAVLEALRVRCRLSATPRLRPLERRHDPRGLLWVLFGSSACPVCSLSATSSLFSTGKRDARWTVYVYALVRTGPRSRRGCNKRASVNDAFAVLPGGVNPCRGARTRCVPHKSCRAAIQHTRPAETACTVL